MNDDLHHLAAAYALDALSVDERRAFEAHYPGCDICSSEVDDYRAVAGELARATAEEPPPALFGQVIAQIENTRQVSAIEESNDVSGPRRAIPGWGYGVLAAAAALLLVVVGVVAINGTSDDSPTDEFAAILAQPDAELASLAGEGTGSLTVVWSPSQGRLGVSGEGVAAVDDGRTYELWLLDDTGARPAGLFRPDESGRVVLVTDLEGQPGGWGVTIEPESGSPQPTGDILFAAEV
ncbi:MAG: anti-sigma factor [Acidimicrobiales bacterium]